MGLQGIAGHPQWPHSSEMCCQCASKEEKGIRRSSIELVKWLKYTGEDILATLEVAYQIYNTCKSRKEKSQMSAITQEGSILLAVNSVISSQMNLHNFWIM
jgi:hypothetical protein